MHLTENFHLKCGKKILFCFLNENRFFFFFYNRLCTFIGASVLRVRIGKKIDWVALLSSSSLSPSMSPLLSRQKHFLTKFVSCFLSWAYRFEQKMASKPWTTKFLFSTDWIIETLIRSFCSLRTIDGQNKKKYEEKSSVGGPHGTVDSFLASRRLGLNPGVPPQKFDVVQIYRQQTAYGEWTVPSLIDD